MESQYINQYFNLRTIMHKYSSVSIFWIFMLCPILVIIEIINRSIKGDKISQFCLATFIGLLSVLAWPPRADVYRQAMIFYEIQGISFKELMTTYFRGGDIILLWLQYYFGQIGLNFEIIRFIFIFIGYYFFFNLYNLIIKNKNLHIKNKNIIFWIVLLSVPFLGITYGLRYALSITILAYYILKRNIVMKYQKGDYLLIILSVLIHFGVIWLISLIIFSKYLPNHLNKILYFCLFIAITLISSYADVILRMLPLGFYSDRLLNFYLATEDLRDNANHNLIGMLPKIINFIYFYLYFLISLIKIPYNKYTKLLFIIFLFCAFTSGLPTLSSRIKLIIYIIGGLYSYQYITNRKLLLYFMVFTALIPTITGWRGYTISHIKYISTPIPISLAQSYDYHWLRHNVTIDGTLLIYNR